MKKLILISALLFSFNGWAEMVEYRIPDKVFFHSCDGPNKSYLANIKNSQLLYPFYPMIFPRRLDDQFKMYTDVDVFFRYQLIHDEEGKVIDTEIIYHYPDNSEKAIERFIDKSGLMNAVDPAQNKWFFTYYQDSITEAFSLGGLGKSFYNSRNNYFRLMRTNNYDGAIRNIEKRIQSKEMDIFTLNTFLSMKAEAMILKKLSKNEKNFEQELGLLNEIRKDIRDRALINTELFYSSYFYRIEYFISKLFLLIYQENGDTDRELKEMESFFEIQAIMPHIANAKWTKAYPKSSLYELFLSPDNLRLLTRYGLLAADKAQYCQSAFSLEMALKTYDFLSSDEGKEYLSGNSFDFFDKKYVNEINESMQILLREN